MQLREILKKEVKVEDRSAIWFPSDWHAIVKGRAEKQGLPIYKYLMWLSDKHTKKENDATLKNL